ncbi:hypothetical protein GQ54DRAFT_12280 [Martensiomyces pterosporus]|nr:hypothetical protein GQ54DRAFT_12280 [Martensiomyces pterosporus]
MGNQKRVWANQTLSPPPATAACRAPSPSPATTLALATSALPSTMRSAKSPLASPAHRLRTSTRRTSLWFPRRTRTSPRTSRRASTSPSTCCRSQRSARSSLCRSTQTSPWTRLA